MRPSRIVVEISSTVRRIPIAADGVRHLVEATLRAERVRDAMVSVAFVGRTAMARLNGRYLRRAGATDVISFGMGRESGMLPVVGDIYICVAVARTNAKRFRLPLREEIARLVVHGVLHVTGEDHPDDEARTTSPMWRKQERILARAR